MNGDGRAFCIVGDEKNDFYDSTMGLGFTGGEVPIGNDGACNPFLVGLPKGAFAPIPNKKSILKAEENQPFLLALAPSLASSTLNCAFEYKTSGKVLSHGSASTFVHYLVDEAAFFSDVCDDETIIELSDGTIAKVKSSWLHKTGDTTTTSSTE